MTPGKRALLDVPIDAGYAAHGQPEAGRDQLLCPRDERAFLHRGRKQPTEAAEDRRSQLVYLGPVRRLLLGEPLNVAAHGLLATGSYGHARRSLASALPWCTPFP
jgi:hypothetical protein